MHMINENMVFAARALHYVFRIANREASYKFYTETLEMKVLRHEEFEEGCKASCNGPYDNMWSKTMVGYGDEDEHFVLELTYNYAVHSYELGNDFKAIHINSSDVFKRVVSKEQKSDDETIITVKDPDGHLFVIEDGTSKSLITKVVLNVKDLQKSQDFWTSLLDMAIDTVEQDRCLLSYGRNQCKLELNLLKSTSLDRKTAFGRIAFSVPINDLKNIEEKVKANDANLIQTPLVLLDTPGKATVWVVILRDPSDHEVCFVGDEGFRELSKVDPESDEAIREAIQKDESRKFI